MNTSALLQFAAESSHAAEESAGGLSEFGLSPIAILLQAGVFVVLYLLLKKFALKNIVKTLDDRRQTINEGLTNAQKATKQLEESAIKQAEMLKTARAEADEIIAQAQRESGVLVKEAEDRASQKAEKIVADAKANLDSEIKRVRTELKKETLVLVAQATATILEEKVDVKRDEKLIKKALEEAA
ncbi:TPA: F0F1 ATP synthase subunit B [Candidatus Saccharibacteria bacterium]|nr:F0F1 ATP synthase subunit B [Candidatus Saccharibacteria bacterium]HIO87274.1 ATP synthase F0 subunit B [Candidatus Saccharibacteria bacterium]